MASADVGENSQRQSDSLPSIDFMDRERSGLEGPTYQSYNSMVPRSLPNTIPISPSVVTTSENHDDKQPASATSSRMSLPSLHEAIFESGSKETTYSQPNLGSYPQGPSSSIPNTPVQRQVPQSSTNIPRNLPPPSIPVSNTTATPKPVAPASNTQHDERYLDFTAPPSAPSSSSNYPQTVPETAYGRTERVDGRYESQNFIVSERNGRRSPAPLMRSNDHFSHGPPPPPPVPSSAYAHEQSVIESRPYAQSSTHSSEYPSSYSHPNPPVLPPAPQQSYHQPMSAPAAPASYSSQAPYESSGSRSSQYAAASYSQPPEPPYSPKVTQGSTKPQYKDPYGHAIDRALDISDLRRELDTVRDNSSYLYHFVMQYTPQSQQQAGHQGPKYTGQTDPALESLEKVLEMSIRTTEALDFWRNKVIADQNRKQEQQRNAIRSITKRPLEYAEDDVADIDDKNSIVTSDSKKQRRGKAAPPGRCHSCNRAETPEWRRGPDGARTLCNACGLHYAKLTRKLTKNPSLSSGLLARKAGPSSMN